MLLQLGTRPRRFGQDEHPPSLEAGHAELLGNQVHPVLERGDERHAGGAVMGDQLAAVPAPVLAVDRNPTPAGELALDPADQPLDFLLHAVVLRDVLAARDDELHEGNALAELGVALEREPVAGQLVRDTLRVVEPVDAQDYCASEELGAQPRDPVQDRVRGGGLGEVGEVDRDREGSDPHDAAGQPDADHAPLALPLHLRLGIHRVQAGEEVRPITVLLEADQIVGDDQEAGWSGHSSTPVVAGGGVPAWFRAGRSLRLA